MNNEYKFDNYTQMMGMDSLSRREQQEKECRRDCWHRLLVWSAIILSGTAFWVTVIVAILEAGRAK